MVIQAGNPDEQAALNSLLWRIVANNGGEITITNKEFMDIPANAKLLANTDIVTDSIIVKAMIDHSVIIQKKPRLIV